MQYYKKTLLIKYVPLSIILLLLICTPAYPHTIFSSDEYYIDGQLTLLYKVVNWWYDCLSNECNMFCGHAIKCTNQGNARVEYNEATKILRVNVEHGFADMLSVFKNCDRRFGLSHLDCTWYNPKYFEGVKPAPVSNLSQYVFHGIYKKQAQAIRSMRNDLLFVVEGSIGGLSKDGTVSLYQSGAFLKKCPQKADDKGNNFPIIVKIMNAKTNEMLAQYMAVWGRSKAFFHR